MNLCSRSVEKLTCTAEPLMPGMNPGLVLASLLEGDKNLLLKVSHPVEDLQLTGPPIAYVHLTIDIHSHTMWYRHERITGHLIKRIKSHTRKLRDFGLRTLQLPLA